jgi:ATP-dependent DNA helicase RecG
LTPGELKNKLFKLIALPAETEWIEFKEAVSNFDFNKLGKYFSALSNEANLKNQSSAWLVFGVRDKPRGIVGTGYRSDRPALDRLKQEIAQHTTSRITFDEIYEVPTDDGRVVMFQIPPALRGLPTAWKGHFYGRDGESLGPLNLNEIENIRGQAIASDWSAQVSKNATLKDLDSVAVDFARKQFRAKNHSLANEVDHWDDATFLNKARICSKGRLTYTAILLLGKPESVYFLSPALAQITWVLKNEQGVEKDYQHFGPPLILAVNEVFGKIRNLVYRYMPNDSLFPTEVKQYDPWVLRETLHNCIAHQDYTQAGRINVVEEPDSLLFTNRGRFIPGTIETIIRSSAPPDLYRNPFLASAMVNLNMIDTIGSGIRRMFIRQRERFFPMPDYDLGEPERVQVRLFGKVIDENFTRLLIEKVDLDLMDVLALDKVQKKRPVTDEETRRLKKRKLIEGRRPNLYVSAKIAALVGDKAAYIKHRAFDRNHYKKMIQSFLTQYGSAGRKEIDDLLLNKLSDTLSHKQKRNKIGNLLFEMAHKDQSIQYMGPRKSGQWHLKKLTK